MADSIVLKNDDQRVGYRPEQATHEGYPLFQWPPHATTISKWLFGFPGFLWPWGVFFIGLALLSWHFLMPDLNTMKHLSIRWIGLLFVQNLVLLVLFAGAWHLRLYVRKAQGTQYKYNSRWLSVDNPTFLFGNQLWDNVFWNVCSAVPIWTAYEVVTFWLQANGYVAIVSWQDHPVYCVLLVVLMPFWNDVHFYIIHRLIHWPPLYRSVHYLHHKNINVGPWSGVAMHPVEHLLFFSAVILFWLIPSHPVHIIRLLQAMALGPSLSHLGFGRVVLGRSRSLSTEDYMHFLHHKYVTVNYGANVVPLDRWFGTYHDGTDEAQAAMNKRARGKTSNGTK
jgi:sterol desaturase/sphingolipid hydroxylase (fatty acid hydroxylase superfamily)